MIESVMGFMLQQTIVVSAALVCILALRTSLRSRFGSQFIYQSWLILPLCLAAEFFPSLSDEPIVISLMPEANTESLVKIANLVPPAHSIWTTVIIFSWITGWLSTALFYFFQHRYFEKQIDILKQTKDFDIATRQDLGPMLVGIIRPRIVMPANYLHDYSDDERRLMLAHEEVHRRRHDPIANLICAAFLCVFWFNPLVHLAAKRFRADQELACDHEVLSKHDQLRRVYADLLVKLVGTKEQHIIHCHINKLVIEERIMNIFKSAQSRFNHRLGQLCLTLLSIIAMSCSWAGTWATAPSAIVATTDTKTKNAAAFMLSLQIEAGGQKSYPDILVREGESASIKVDLNGTQQQFNFKLAQTEDTSENLALEIEAKKDQDTPKKVKLVIELKKSAQIEIRNDKKNEMVDDAVKLTIKATRHRQG